jgi:hypothetical protein
MYAIIPFSALAPETAISLLKQGPHPKSSFHPEQANAKQSHILVALASLPDA